MTDSNVASRASETVVSETPAEYTDPVDLSTEVNVVHGVALVTCRIRNRTPVPRGVRVIDRLDGPTLPPRSNGVSAAGWTDSTHETVVPAGETTAVGYACPLGGDATVRESVEEPVELDAVGAPAIGQSEEDNTEQLVAHARRLGDSRPPRDAIPEPECDAGGAGGDGNTGVTADTGGDIAVDADRTAADTDRTAASDDSTAAETGCSAAGDDRTTRDTDSTTKDTDRTTRDTDSTTRDTDSTTRDTDSTTKDTDSTIRDTDRTTRDTDHTTTDTDSTTTAQTPLADGICPVPVETYFDRAAVRIQRAEATTDGSVESVAAAFRQNHHTPVTLEQAVARDEAALRAIAERAAELADRAAETEVPVDSLRRLA